MLACCLFAQVKRAIGSLLIDENAGLFEEVAALADILGDVQLSTSALLSRQNLCSNPQRRMVGVGSAELQKAETAWIQLP